MRFHNRWLPGSLILGAILFTALLFAGAMAAVAGDTPGGQGPEEAEKGDLDRVLLYFVSADGRFLTSEQRPIPPGVHPAVRARAILLDLIGGPEGNLEPALPPQTELRAFFLTRDGTAFVDFSEAVRAHHPGGVRAELLSVYAVVNSLIYNIGEIRNVKILVGGAEVDTLAGHVDIQGPLAARMLLVR